MRVGDGRGGGFGGPVLVPTALLPFLDVALPIGRALPGSLAGRGFKVDVSLRKGGNGTQKRCTFHSDTSEHLDRVMKPKKALLATF